MKIANLNNESLFGRSDLLFIKSDQRCLVISASLYNSQLYQINPYNQILNRADTRCAKAAAIVKDTTSATALASPTGYVYKLKWRGSDKI